MQSKLDDLLKADARACGRYFLWVGFSILSLLQETAQGFIIQLMENIMSVVGFGAAGDQALNQLNNLPFDNIIGGPLNAAIRAQAQAAETTVDFIQSVGMREVNGQKEAINVQFVYQDSAGTTRRITVPILAIVPIPFIVIDNVAISFKAKITASASAQSSESKSQSGYINGYVGYQGTRLRAGLSAGYSAKKDSKASQESKYSVEYTMDVQVNASQAGLPAGMEAVLGFLQQGTHELPLNVQAQTQGYNGNQAFASTSTATFAYTFSLIVNNASGQPLQVANSQITVVSSNGFFSGTVSDSGLGGVGDGLYKIDLTPTNWPSPLVVGSEIVDNITITIDDGNGNVEVISRPIKVRIT